jgi:uncharacterized protein (TIGR02594 family)
MNKTKRLYLAIVFLLIFHSAAFASAISRNIVKNASYEIGNGEIGGDNKGKYVQMYCGQQNVSWCAGFVSYVLNRSGVKELGYNLSARQILYKGRKLGWEVKQPQAGDIIVFWRGSKNGSLGHTGIIEKVENNTIYTIEGNVGKYPAKVKRFQYKKSEIKNLLGFVRIRKE